MVVAEKWAEQRVLMRAFANSADQTRPTIFLHGTQLAIGPAGIDPSGSWGIHVEPPIDGRAQELRGQLELAARRLAGSKGNPPRLMDEVPAFEGKVTHHWAPGTPPALPATTGASGPGDYYEPTPAVGGPPPPALPLAAAQPAAPTAAEGASTTPVGTGQPPSPFDFPPHLVEQPAESRRPRPLPPPYGLSTASAGARAPATPPTPEAPEAPMVADDPGQPRPVVTPRPHRGRHDGWSSPLASTPPLRDSKAIWAVGRSDAASRGKPRRNIKTVRGIALGAGASMSARRGGPTDDNRVAAIILQSMPPGFQLSGTELEVLDALGEHAYLTTSQVEHITHAADAQVWMQRFMQKLAGYGLDVIVSGRIVHGEPSYQLSTTPQE